MNKKLLCTLTIVLFSLGLLISNHNFVVSAYEQDYKYEYACDLKYSVDYINDDGTFANVACYGDFSSAKAKMKENNDYVVRHINGYSPTRIVAMNSGIAYSYSRSSGKDETINIYEGVKGGVDNTHTYVTRYFQMEYIDTNYMSEVSNYEGEGYIHVNLGGFDGYADLEYTDLVPSKYIDKGIPIYLGGPYGGVSKSPYLTIIEPDYYIIESNDKYNDLVLYYHNAYPDASGKAKCWHMSIASASDFSFLSKGTKYYSPDGINFYNSYNRNSRTLIGSGYNYYQYLPLRSKSSISASQINNFLVNVKGSGTNSVIKDKGSVFKNAEDAYGSNAAIVFSMACWESAYGTSGYALQRNNLFGWRAYDSDPNNAYTFDSVDACINQHAGGNLRDYSDYKVSWFNGAFLGNKGAGFNLKYASDPYWGAGIASIYYSLDKFACNNDGNLLDHNKYDLGIVKTFGAPIYSDANGSNVYFYCKYSASRNLNYMVTVLEDVGTYYKIQLANPISGGSVIAYEDGIIDYSWSQSVGYIKKSDITLITNNNAITTATKEHSPKTAIENVKFENGDLIISGIGIITNYDFNNSNNVTHTINIYNSSDDSLVKSFVMNNIDSSWYSINDGCDYTYGGFSGTINLDDISFGTYYLSLNTCIAVNNSTVSKDTILKSSKLALRYSAYANDTISYKLTTNTIYSYRFELDVAKKYSEIDLVNVNKPTSRQSMVAIDSIDINDSGVMSVCGAGMIYNLDYASQCNNHTLYLVNNEHLYEFSTDTVKSEVDFKSLYQSNYVLDYINYEATLDLNNVESGTYYLVLKLSNGTYFDYNDMTNRFGYSYSGLNIEGLSCSFATDSFKSRILVNITNN